MRGRRSPTRLALATVAGIVTYLASTGLAFAAAPAALDPMFQQDSGEFGVPAPLLKAICYQGPSTASGLVPQLCDGTDVMDESDNVEPPLSYVYTTKQRDAVGIGDTMYQVWYGEFDQAHTLPRPTPTASSRPRTRGGWRYPPEMHRSGSASWSG